MAACLCETAAARAVAATASSSSVWRESSASTKFGQKAHARCWQLTSKAASHVVGGSRLQVLTLETCHATAERRDWRAFSARAESSEKSEKAPFGYTRKDVIGICVGVLAAGFGTKYALEAFGMDSIQAGNVVQIIFVAVLMLAWTFTYVFRVGNKEMTYVQQLKDYEDAVMKKRLDEMPETELEAMLAEIEEEKLRIKARREKKNQSQS